ncbi:N-acyl homoserine lactonase family protein [Sphingomonas sabuli]|uniref:N-acyl homoserine lactonase family protein n=1 Tax=Sphingomonas sabuli TaxID=2764186 RepID=A0A7G9L290_9SPHN|nr:N-acyl homoserine lactonase family protein [Sphingomonas sabuli]QNM82739.1 N-acyl homoserine lactonase family protein [Sphingomonas sabuli]
MKVLLAALALAVAAGGQAASPTDTPAKIKLWRLDCGRLDENAARKWAWQKVPTPAPCFLVAHGTRYLLWDSGLSVRALGNAHPTAKLDRTIADQLAQIGIAPEQVEFVGISHYHGDHTGQASKFPRAKLLIGAGDFAALKTTPAPGGAAPPHLQPWLDGKLPVEAVVEDHDVFGDGSVTMIPTPGHTPGHSVLLVNLATGPVILAGDLWFSYEDMVRGAMPHFNSSRAETLASRDRISRLAEKLDAVVVVQHDPADVVKLPAFPNAAE